jgi:hypothetical protein
MRLSGKQVMLDLETLDTVPGGVILSIGACVFDEYGVNENDTFYSVVSQRSCNEVGLSVNQSTLEWWTNQTETARKVLHESVGEHAVPLAYALGHLNGWLEKHDFPPVWTNGPGFDEAFLAVAARRVGVPPPITFRKSRCFRTIKALHGDDVVAPMNVEGVAHNALDDAIWQARFAVSIFRYLSSFQSDLK